MPGHAMMAVVAGLASGLLFLVGGRPQGSAGLPIIELLVALPLFLSALSGGVRQGALAVLVAAVLVAGIAGTPLVGLGFVLVYGLAPVVLTRQALLFRADEPDAAGTAAVEWYPPGLLLAWLTGIAVAGLLIVVALFAVQGEDLQAWVAQAVGVLMSELAGNAADPATAAALDTALRVLQLLMPGMAAALWLLVMAGNGALAQAILRVSGHALRPSPRLEALRLLRLVPLGFGLCLALALVGFGSGFVFANLAVVLGAALIVQGLAVLHRVSRSWPARPWLLGAIYVVALALSWPLLVLVIMGIADCLLRTGPRPAYSGPEKKD